MTVLKFKTEEWKAMQDLKSSIAFMKSNNEKIEGTDDYRYDNALHKNKKALQYFMNNPERM